MYNSSNAAEKLGRSTELNALFFAAQLVKPVKGLVMPVKKKRKLSGTDDHEHKCKITR